MKKKEFIELAEKYLTAIEKPRNAFGINEIKIFGIEELYKAINFTDSSLLLKEKKGSDFEDWKSRHLIDRNHFNNTFLHDTEGWIKEECLIYKYNSEVMNL